jgi:DNA modification methylase
MAKVATAEHFIGVPTTKNGTMVDFFAGGGTTIVAAQNLARRWIAFQTDEKAVLAYSAFGTVPSSVRRNENQRCHAVAWRVRQGAPR